MAGSVIERVFGTKYRVLAFFVERPEGAFYVREIAKSLGLAPMTVHRNLVALRKGGVLISREEGGKRFFKMKSSYITRQLRILTTLDSGLVRDFMKRFPVHTAEVIALYGSRASGESTEGSDWDFIVIGKLDQLRLNKIISKIEQKHGCEISVKLYPTAADFKNLERNDPAFYREVLKNHVVLRGALP
ncbi:MAG: nucleotidyltransferase domain-containing protein [Spirochaetota bacterium]